MYSYFVFSSLFVPSFVVLLGLGFLVVLVPSFYYLCTCFTFFEDYQGVDFNAEN